MILLLACCGILSGLTLVIFKVLGEAIATDHHFSWFIFFLAISGAACITAMTILINVVMKIYKQIEVVPVYESMVIIFSIAAGLVLFDEASFYTWLELLGIFGSTLLILIGIVVLSFKHNVVKQKDAESPVLENALVSDELDADVKARRDKWF